MSGLREAVERLTDAWDHDRDAYHVGSIHAAIVADLRALLAEHPATPTEEVAEVAVGLDFIKRLVGAWGCCGTCAGGVLAAHVAAVAAKAKAEALREAADEVERLERIGRTRADAISDDEREWFHRHDLSDLDNGFQRNRTMLARWLHERADREAT